MHWPINQTNANRALRDCNNIFFYNLCSYSKVNTGTSKIEEILNDRIDCKRFYKENVVAAFI